MSDPTNAPCFTASTIQPWGNTSQSLLRLKKENDEIHSNKPPKTPNPIHLNSAVLGKNEIIQQTSNKTLSTQQQRNERMNHPTQQKKKKGNHQHLLLQTSPVWLCNQTAVSAEKNPE